MIEERLKRYKQNKADVETTLSRCQVWQDMINNNDLESLIYTPTRIEGMPKALRINSPVESEVMQRCATIEGVQSWIKEDTSRIFFKKLEVEQIEGALRALTPEQRFVIEQKYFDETFWSNIEINFNNKFNNRAPIQKDRLKEIKTNSLKIITDILTPFYERYYIEQERG